MMTLPLFQGCATSAGLIMAIGTQNAFVLKQGLLKNQLFVTALFCSLADALLIALGVGGLGTLLTSHLALLQGARWGGALFLLWYGLRSFRATFQSEKLHVELASGAVCPPLQETLLTLAAFTFLNPHVYLDTVLLIGSVGAQCLPEERPFFALGAMVTSFVWFFSLSYGSQLLAPLFEKPIAWKLLDFSVGCLMWSMAFSLLFFG